MKNKKIKIFVSIFAILFLICGCIYLYFINNIENPQDNYAKYLVDSNNKFVRNMYDFVHTNDTIDSLSQEEKEKALSNMCTYVLNQNNIVENIIKNPPDDSNIDYYDATEQIRQTYLFLLQGEISILEQMYLEADERDTDKLQTGFAMQNTMGEIILQLPNVINQIRNTDYKADYTYIPDDDSIIVNGIKTDKEYKEFLEEEMGGSDENAP